MLIFPIQFPRRPRSRGSGKLPAPPPPALVTVVSATLIDFHQVRFVFSEPVSCDGSGNEQIIITNELGPETSVESVQESPTAILFWFESGFIVVGDAWDLIAVPSGLDFHGRTCAVPQSGLIG
ncbi:MAG: hypothetical protein QOF78_2605 [Phycisphaerales bacterium]|jgi:hypothetical protein|nr:hypothetical protein [Phycisphaerales bacterium]